MKRKLLSGYLLNHFVTTFTPLFGALFLVASVVAFIRLATLTSAVKISFLEMILLYLTQVPTILLYTLPMTFFASLTLTLAKLSFDLELIILFSLKTSPWEIMKPFVWIALLLSGALLLIGLTVQPKSIFMQQLIVNSKKDEMRVNIRPSEFGQRFGEWMLFVGSQDESSAYGDVVLFSQPKNNGGGGSYFVVAKNAEVLNEKGLLSLVLKDGHAHLISQSHIQQVDYSQMKVNEPGHLKEFEFKGIVEHWQRAGESKAVARELVWALLAGVFVVFCLPAAAAFGIHNPRFEKNRAGAWALLMIVFFYAPALILGDTSAPLAFLVPAFWLIFAFWFYRRRVGRTF